MLMKLDPPAVAKLKPRETPYYITDTLRRGLQLRVAGGSKTWSVRYRFGKQERRMALGNADVISLAAARQAAKDALRDVENGIDPAAVKHARREADTVGDFATTYIEKYAKVKKRSWKDDEQQLNKDVLPAWRHRLMQDITRRDVRELLEGIAERAPIVANRTRSLLHKMWNVAITADIVESNPVTMTDKPGEEQQRDRVLTHDEIRKLWKACDALPLEMGATFKLRLITAQRAGEVIDMPWSELDLDAGWWTIAAERSKNGLAHRVPLSTPALTILKTLRVEADKLKTPPTYVLAGARSKRLQAEAITTIGIKDFRGHDLRRTAASLMAGSGVQRLVISKVLNHVESGVTAVYDRHSYDAEKRIALDAWGRTLVAIIASKGTKVVAFTR